MHPIILALISYLCWGTGDIFGTIISRKINAYQTAFWYFLISTPLSLVLLIFFPGGIENLTPGVFVLLVGLGIVAAASMLAFYESLREGSATLAATISGAFPAVVVPLSIIFLGEHITIRQLLAIATIMIGIILSTLDFKELKGGNFKLSRSIFFALAAMLLFGIYWSFIKIPINQIGWVWPNALGIVSIFTIYIYLKFKKIKIDVHAVTKLPAQLILNAVLLVSGALSFNLALSLGGNVSIITPSCILSHSLRCNFLFCL